MDACVVVNPTLEAEEITGLTSVMEQLAITTATAIKTGEPLRYFVLSLEGHIANSPQEGDVH
jgi:hypothetical protein